MPDPNAAERIPGFCALCKSRCGCISVVENGRLILFVSCAMHSTEAAGAQFGMEFAHALATSDAEPWRSARDELVTVVYTTNPDGVDHVTNWYRETVGTPHEAAGLLKLFLVFFG